MSEEEDIILGLGFNELRCPDHRHRGDLPCPWPDCENGYRRDKIKGYLLGTEMERNFIRRKWTALDGGQRYAWDDPGWSSWFMAPSIIFAELERQGLRQISTPNAIYHYTSAAALISIVNSDDLWLTDIDFLNDSSEFHYGMEILRSALEELLAQGAEQRLLDLLDAWKRQAESESDYRICLACFSLDGDSLSQWRGYGSGEMGVSIGFNPSLLALAARESILDSVEYDRSRQVRRIAISAHTHLELAKWDSGKETRADPFMTGTYDRLLRDLLFMKHPSFSDEREVRLVYAEAGELLDRERLSRAPTHFRSAGNRIVPYTTLRDLSRQTLAGRPLPSPELGPLPIVEVVVGPQKESETLTLGVSRLLDSADHDAQVRASSIPFRNSD